MSKGFKGFLIGLVTLISIFLGALVGFSIKNNHNPYEELKSWFVQEVEASEDDELVDLIPDNEEIEQERPDVTFPEDETITEGNSETQE